MKRHYILAPEAAHDLVQIWRYLKSESGENTADRVEFVIRSKIIALADSPNMGHWRRDLTMAEVHSFWFTRISSSTDRTRNRFRSLAFYIADATFLRFLKDGSKPACQLRRPGPRFKEPGKNRIAAFGALAISGPLICGSSPLPQLPEARPF